MIDYKEMENVIQNLKDYVSKVEKISETQKKLDNYINEIDKIKSNISEIESSISNYSKNIEGIEQSHEKNYISIWYNFTRLQKITFIFWIIRNWIKKDKCSKWNTW